MPTSAPQQNAIPLSKGSFDDGSRDCVCWVSKTYPILIQSCTDPEVEIGGPDPLEISQVISVSLEISIWIPLEKLDPPPIPVVIRTAKLRVPFQSQYTLHGQTLESVDSAKYLVVTISQDLNWNKHINNITGKANRTLGFIKSIVKTNNESVKELAYKTLVRPQVEYASTICSPHTKQNTQKIEMVQKRAARWVKNNYSTYDSVSLLLDNLGWRSLENRRIDFACSCSTELFMVM